MNICVYECVYVLKFLQNSCQLTTHTDISVKKKRRNSKMPIRNLSFGRKSTKAHSYAEVPAVQKADQICTRKPCNTCLRKLSKNFSTTREELTFQDIKDVQGQHAPATLPREDAYTNRLAKKKGCYTEYRLTNDQNRKLQSSVFSLLTRKTLNFKMSNSHLHS